MDSYKVVVYLVTIFCLTVFNITLFLLGDHYRNIVKLVGIISSHMAPSESKCSKVNIV